VLSLRGLHVAYGVTPAVRGIDLDVAAGEVVALVGANGAGKSTTLKTISGLVRATSGTVAFQGRPIGGLAPEAIVDLGIVHVPEGRRVFPRLSVEQNLQVGAHALRGRSQAGATRDRVYDSFPRLRERRRQAAGSLSGGEQQMLAFGRAMMAQPLLLLLDEPSLGLAPIMVEEVARGIERFRDDGVTILLVEQNAELALTLATRGYVIETGAIVLTDTSERLRRDPKIWASYLGQEDWEYEDAMG